MNSVTFTTIIRNTHNQTAAVLDSYFLHYRVFILQRNYMGVAETIYELLEGYSTKFQLK